MLRFLRKYSNSAGIKILYAVLAALFVVWGVGAVGGERVDIVARVHGEDITKRELDRTTAVLQRRYEEMFKDRFSAELARSLDLRSRALDQLIEQALIRDEAERLGITVTDNELVDTITRLPELQDNGRFNRERLESFLREQRDRGEFEDELRRSILFQRLQSLVSDGVQVTDAEIEERYKLDHDQVNLAFVRVSAVEQAKTVTLTDEDLQKHLDEHPDRYRVPAKTRARYVAYKPADFVSQVEVKDGEVAEQYELQKDDHFTEPEQVRARHILVKVASGAADDQKAKARQKATDLLAKVKAGGDFAGLAKQSSEDTASALKGGDLGFFPRGQMAPEFEAAAFALEPGGLSDVVESPFGFHIIKVEEKRAAGTKPLAAARDEIVASLKNERALEIAHREAEADRRKVLGGKSFVEALSSRTVQETPPFSADGIVPGLGRMKDFADVAFALAPGEVSDLIETESAVYLLTPFERTEPHAPTLDDVRERVTADARRARGEALAKEQADRLLARAKEIGLEKAAAEIGAAGVDETGPFDRRTGNLPKLGASTDLRNDAFTLRPEAPLAQKVYVVTGDGVVASLRGRTPADMSGLAAAKDSLEDTLLQQKRNAALSAYMDYLKQRAQREGTLEVRSNALGPG
jgi:peptidyl-prolyl cis-trans isomerase D